MSFFPILNEPKRRNLKLWRYMDISKFLYLLDTSNLYFSRADTFQDPYEGSLTRLDKENYPENIKSLFINSIPHIYINCWHVNDYESAAMWDLYTSTREALAIETTYERLRDALHPCIALSLVKYIDYNNFSIIERSFEETRSLNLFNMYIYKRISFSHENELRAMIWDEMQLPNEFDILAKGINIPIDFNKLVTAIHISPHAAPWFAELICSLLKRYNIFIEVKQSQLYQLS